MTLFECYSKPPSDITVLKLSDTDKSLFANSPLSPVWLSYRTCHSCQSGMLWYTCMILNCIISVFESLQQYHDTPVVCHWFIGKHCAGSNNMFSTMLGLLYTPLEQQQYNISWLVWEIHLQLTKNVQLPLPSRQYDVDNHQWIWKHMHHDKEAGFCYMFIST